MISTLVSCVISLSESRRDRVNLQIKGDMTIALYEGWTPVKALYGGSSTYFTPKEDTPDETDGSP